jgi:hypothetical protein
MVAYFQPKMAFYNQLLTPKKNYEVGDPLSMIMSSA